MEVDILLPENLSEIPLSRYQDFLKMQKNSNDDEFIAQKMIQIFCGIELGEVAKLKLIDLNKLVAHFHKVFKERPQLIRQFKIKNIEFGFIPKLDDISFGEYVDLEHYLKDWETYHKAMAVMYRPIKDQYKDKYSIEEYKPNSDMQELMKFAPLDAAISASVFFYALGKELLIATNRYLQKQLTEMITSTNSQNELNSQNSGNGIHQSMLLLQEILRGSMMSQKWDLLNVSPISPLKNKKQKLKTAKLKDK
jgi:hypothetical protein